ncbi:hypothetical protein [Xanthomonas sacchari]|uniref:hypothetical protein n=1 Tax=Xanthomonas sacchari TaxID=56458 RepID=UPI0020C598DC|nr:hypothetical protein [Xanthomonas sacchari]
MTLEANQGEIVDNKVLAVAAIFAAASSIPATSLAQTVDNVTCDACSDQQMNQSALQYGRALSPPADINLYVLNPSGNTAKKFEIIRDYDGGDACRKYPKPNDVNCQVFTHTTPLSVEPIVVDYLGYMRAAIAFNSQEIPVTGDGLPGSAYDDMTHPQKRTAVHNYLMARYETWITVINGLAGKGWSTFQNFRIKFPDGSTVIYRWDVVNQMYQPIPISYKDRLGNIIPIKQEQLTEGRGGVITTFDFSHGNGSDVATIIVSLSNIGISVPPPPPSPKKMVCKSEAYNGGVKVTCGWG